MKAESLELRDDSPAKAGEKDSAGGGFEEAAGRRFQGEEDNEKEMRAEGLEMRGKRQECRFSQGALKTPGGSWLDWRSAWRDMGRREEEIEAEAARREEEAAAQEFAFFEVKKSSVSSSSDAHHTRVGARARRRLFARRFRARTWGRSDELTVKMKARLAPLAGYFLRAIKNEFVTPSWGVGERGEMTLARLYELACGGASRIFGAADKGTRWRDFSRVIEWTRNTIKGWAFRGEWERAKADVALGWLDGAADAPMEFPRLSAAWERKCRAKLKAAAEAASYSQENGLGFTDTGARESFYESKKTFLTNTAPAEAGFSPLARSSASELSPLVGARAFEVPDGEFDFFSSKGSLGGERVGDSPPSRAALAGGEPQASSIRLQADTAVFACGKNLSGSPELEARGSEPKNRIPKFPKGKKFPRRLWWLVWRWYGAFKDLHWGKAVEWSGACFISWFKSCLAAGKRCADLYDLYAEKLIKWHGLACDWRIAQDALHPKGLYAELYRAAAGLPGFSPEAKTKAES